MVTYAEMAAVNNRLAALAEIVRLMNGRIDNDAEAINGLFEAAVVSLGTARGLAKLLEELAVQVQHLSDIISSQKLRIEDLEAGAR